MYSRDYILKLVQQLAQVLARVTGLKEKGEPDKAAAVINEAYKELLGLDRSYVAGLETSTMIPALKDQHHLTNEQLEVLAKLLYEDASIVAAEKTGLYKKSLTLLEYLNKEQKLYSFERESLINTIKNGIN
jgi:hypothetical protein